MHGPAGGGPVRPGAGNYMPDALVVISVPMLVYAVSRLPPRVVTAVTTKAPMTAAINAYSSAVTPSRHCANARASFANFVIVVLLPFVEAVLRAGLLTANTRVFAPNRLMDC